MTRILDVAKLRIEREPDGAEIAQSKRLISSA